MIFPLNDYFINSLMNLFLLSCQFLGNEIKVDSFIKGIKKGCRFLEISIEVFIIYFYLVFIIHLLKDDEDKGDPIISKPFFLRRISKILFKDFLIKLKENAFIHSPFPIIINLKVFCSLHNEDKLAEIILETIPDDYLYKFPLNYKEQFLYPTPKQLEKKIIFLIKGTIPDNNYNEKSQILVPPLSSDKNLDTSLNISNTNEMDENSDMKIDTNTNVKNIIAMQVYNKKHHVSNYGVLNPNNLLLRLDEGSEEEKEEHKNIYYKSNYEQNLNSYFDDLKINIQKINFPNNSHNKYNNIYETENNFKNYKIKKNNIVHKSKSHKVTSENLLKLCSFFEDYFSFDKNEEEIWKIGTLDDKKMKKYMSRNESKFTSFHKRNISIVNYSDNSSDMQTDAYSYFLSGVQICNFNNPDLLDTSLLVTFSKFQENGGENCGYLLKPTFLLTSFQKSIVSEDFNNLNSTLTLKIISGQQILSKRSDINYYIELGLKGIESEQQKNKIYQISMKETDGFNIIFKEENCIFDIYCPELCSIYLKIYEDLNGNNKLFGWGSIPFTSIRSGYRVFPIRDLSLNLIDKCYILCHVDINRILNK